MDYLKLAGGNLLFSLVIVAVAFVLGYFFYSRLVLRRISLRESLFSKDNVAAWIEFIGAFIFPTLFLSAMAIEGSASSNLWLDLLICAGYAAAYVIAFTALRLLSGFFVKTLGKKDEQGSVDLNSEIYSQSNIAASLFSASLSMVFVSAIRFLDFSEGYFIASLLKVLVVAVLSIAAFAIYALLLGRKTSLFNEIFIDNNPAAGISLVGFIFAVQVLLTNAATLQLQFDLADLVVTGVIWLVLLGVLSFAFKAVLTKLIKVDIWKEVYADNNIGAAIGQCALYTGIAIILTSFIK